MAREPDVPDWFRPLRHAVILAQQGRGSDANMRAAVLHALGNMPVGTAWVAPPELLDRIEPVASKPVWPNVRRDPSWLKDALASTARKFTVDPEQLPGRLVVKAN